MAILNVGNLNFDKQVLKSSTPVLVTFHASYCEPSQKLIRLIESLEGKFGKRVKLAKVDAEGATDKILKRYKVNRVPFTMLFEAGRCVDFIGGLVSKNSISQMIESRLKPVLLTNELTFEAEVSDTKLPVLVHFDASWCRQSQALVPLVDRIAEEFRGRVKTVRIEHGPDTAQLCARFGVQRFPTLALLVNGRVEDQILGGLERTAKSGKALATPEASAAYKNIQEMLELAIL